MKGDFEVMDKYRKAVWLNSVEEIATADESSLRRSLITLDGRGPAFKETILNELLRRAKEENK